MTSNPSHRPISALRARMIEDMTVRGFTEDTRSDYVRNVRAFGALIGRPPDTATAEDLRRFQLHQRQTGMQPPSVNNAVAALRFFFIVTLDQGPGPAARGDARTAAAAGRAERRGGHASAPGGAAGPKYKAALATAYGVGLRVSEVVALAKSTTAADIRWAEGHEP
jgi:integrase/recombinase XerD